MASSQSGYHVLCCTCARPMVGHVYSTCMVCGMSYFRADSRSRKFLCSLTGLSLRPCIADPVIRRISYRHSLRRIPFRLSGYSTSPGWTDTLHIPRLRHSANSFAPLPLEKSPQTGGDQGASSAPVSTKTPKIQRPRVPPVHPGTGRSAPRKNSRVLGEALLRQNYHRAIAAAHLRPDPLDPRCVILVRGPWGPQTLGCPRSPVSHIPAVRSRPVGGVQGTWGT